MEIKQSIEFIAIGEGYMSTAQRPAGMSRRDLLRVRTDRNWDLDGPVTLASSQPFLVWHWGR